MTPTAIRNTFTTRAAGLVILALAAAAGPATLAAPFDCTGIYDVSDVDGSAVSDFDGSLDTVLIATGLQRPLFITSPPGDTSRLFLVEQDGTIRIVKDGTLLPADFLDISAITRSPIDPGGNNEEGLLGLAFHPNYDNDGTQDWFFVYHTNTTGAINGVARYSPDSGNPDLADASSRLSIIGFQHPLNGNHNGGFIGFAPDDGYLYIATGDGGGSCDDNPAGQAQDLDENQGKIHRLDVNTDKVSAPFYDIPTDNPFFGGASSADDTVWSYGLRNPWRCAFDEETHALYIADVGQNQWEELNCSPGNSPGGENYGWDHYEGDHCPNPSCGNEGTCALGDYVAPILEYNQSEPGNPCSITGGYIYRGCRMGDLGGTYFYADFCSDFIRSIRSDGTCSASGITNREDDLDPDGTGGGAFINNITSFGQDARGEIYIADRDGDVYRIVPTMRLMQVSGPLPSSRLPGVPETHYFTAGTGDWEWEDLEGTWGSDIGEYKVYRSNTPTGTFDCVHHCIDNSWAGGDGQNPLAGEAFYYLTTAVDDGGEESRAGNRSDGTARVVNTASVCPAANCGTVDCPAACPP